MWMPTNLGTEIAQRKLTLRIDADTLPVVLRVGQPVRAPEPNESEPWFCPMRFEGLGPEGRLFAIAGEDSLQALVLALEYARRMLPRFAKEAGGTLLVWASEDLDVVSPQRDLVAAYAEASAEALHGVRAAEAALRGTDDPPLQILHENLAALVTKYGER